MLQWVPTIGQLYWHKCKFQKYRTPLNILIFNFFTVFLCFLEARNEMLYVERSIILYLTDYYRKYVFLFYFSFICWAHSYKIWRYNFFENFYNSSSTIWIQWMKELGEWNLNIWIEGTFHLHWNQILN